MTATLPLISRKRQGKRRADAPPRFLAQFPLQQTSSIRAAWIAKERGQQVAQYEALYGYLGSAPGSPTRAATAGIITLSYRVCGKPVLCSKNVVRCLPLKVQAELPVCSSSCPSVTNCLNLSALACSRCLCCSCPLLSTLCADGSLGVIAGTEAAQNIRRAFRRLEPQCLAEQPRKSDDPMWAYWQQQPVPVHHSAEGYVLVPAARLTELAALEKALTAERAGLSRQCAVVVGQAVLQQQQQQQQQQRAASYCDATDPTAAVLADAGQWQILSARVPQEVVRLAVRSACHTEMARVHREHKQWLADEQRTLTANTWGK
jgi:hypothetical protein